jgi:hypothetical protein
VPYFVINDSHTGYIYANPDKKTFEVADVRIYDTVMTDTQINELKQSVDA